MDRAVRGSPLLRTLLIALCLGLTAVPLWRMTRERALVVPIASAVTPTSAAAVTPFGLQLSAPAQRVLLRDENGAILWEAPANSTATEIEATWPRLPRSVHAEIIWADATAAPRYFAKLRLDPPGRETLTHVFDATTNLDDLWELP